VVSIEMFEAVGREYWPSFFQTLKAQLKRDGRACLQTITIRDDLFERYVRSTDFIQQYIFPGGLLPSPQAFRAAAAEAGLAIVAELDFGATTDVRLAIRPLDSYETPATIRVNEHDHAYSKEGPLPSIAGSAAGFAVCWHEMTDGKDGARARLVSLDGVAPVPELVPDADEGRASRIVWTGSEFIAVNDNRIKEDVMDVHLRRLDPSGNSQLAAGWGPWRELNLSDQTPGTGSSNPDVALYGAAFGVVWVERETTDPGFGRIWFASVVHR